MNLILISLGIILIGSIIWIIKSNKSYVTENNETFSSPSGDETTPDLPSSFGYKCTWLAVKTSDSKKLTDLLHIKKITPCNWKYGIEGAYNKSIFVTPPVDGWILVCGNSLPAGDSDNGIDEIKEILKTLSKEFKEAQYFCTHRVVEFHCWMKAIDGNVIRVYSFLGESGENICVEGKASDFEKKYKLINTFSKEAQDSNYYERTDLIQPNESFLMEVAGNWSINPAELDKRGDLPKSLGLIGKWK